MEQRIKWVDAGMHEFHIFHYCQHELDYVLYVLACDVNNGCVTFTEAYLCGLHAWKCVNIQSNPALALALTLNLKITQ